jgi:hypothetical protein
MISTRRIVTAVGLAVGVTGLAAPLASAASADAQDAGKFNPVATLDALVVTDIPAGRQAEIPRVSHQSAGLSRRARRTSTARAARRRVALDIAGTRSQHSRNEVNQISHGEREAPYHAHHP